MKIILENTSKSYSDTTVIQNLSYTFHTGTVYALHGPSGSGKTTLLRLLAGLEIPSGGVLKIPHGCRISFDFQEPRLFPHLRVRENLCIHDPERNVDEMLQTLDLSDTANKFPHELSGGMKKRVSIARALLKDADLYLLDEPTAGQDEVRRQQIADAILRHTKDSICIVATHDAPLTNLLHAEILDIQG